MPLWHVVSQLCALGNALEAAGVEKALTARLDGIIDGLVGCLLPMAAANDPEPLCPTCGAPLDEENPCDTP